MESIQQWDNSGVTMIELCEVFTGEQSLFVSMSSMMMMLLCVVVVF